MTIPCPILLTGFEPFDRFHVNSSWEAVRLAGRRLGPGIVTARLPVDHRLAAGVLAALLERHRPTMCLLTGLADEPSLRIERFGRRPPELAGPWAPARLAGSWPLYAAVKALRAAGLPARISQDAGGYVCDSTYWSLLDFRRRHGWPACAGFLHVPPLSPRFTGGALARGMETIVRRQALRTRSAGTAPSIPPG